MFRNSKENLKKLLCRVLIFTMVFTSVTNGISAFKLVSAEGLDKENITVNTNDKLEKDKEEKEVIDENNKEEKESEDERTKINDIVNKIQSNMGMLSVKIINDFTKVKVGDKIELEVKDELNQAIPVENLIFTVSNEKLGRMDEEISNKFITLSSGTIVITVALKDKPNISDQVEFKIEENIKKVYMRVEGYNHTVLPRTEIDVPLYDISSDLGEASGSSGTKSSGWDVSKFDNPTNAHAIVYALTKKCGMRQNGDNKSKETFDFQDYGWSLYIARIGEDEEFDQGGISGWMYRVNGVMPNVGCNATELNDGDEIVWYYGAYGFDNIYTKLIPEKVNIKIGEEVKLHLLGYQGGYENEEVNIGEATIIVNQEEYSIDGEIIKTDKGGNAFLRFDKAGEYKISSTRTAKEEDGKMDIVRPEPITILVEELGDTEKPIIKVENLIDGQELIEKELSFKITITDNVDKDIVPIVKLNGEVITGTNGEYKVTLKDGENTISIEATDLAGNKVDGNYKVIYKGTVVTPKESLEKVVGYYKKDKVQPPAANWEAFVALWGAEGNLVEDYEWKSKDSGFNAETDYNDHIYYIFSLLTLGENPAKAWETNRNLFAELASQQKENGSFGNLGKHIWSIVALDVGKEIGVDVGTWNNENRNKAINFLLSNQKEDGGFGGFSKIDYTGWSLIALSKSTGEQVEEAINKGKQYLKSMQQENGAFGGTGWEKENSNSIACAIQGLIAIGEDISNPEGYWSKNGRTPVDALLKYQQEDGSFRWNLDSDASIGMATKQSAVAMSDIVNGKSTWHKLGEITFKEEDKEAPTIKVEGIVDGKIVIEEELNFKVIVTDNVDKDIVPIVKLNGEVITGTNGEYKVTLKDGESTISIEATDVAGNKADASYKVIYNEKSEEIKSPKEQLDKNLAYILRTVDNPTLGTGAGEWSILCLARGNYPVPEGYYDKYYNNVVKVVQDNKGVLHKVKYTEHSRLILGLTSIGKDVTDVGGYNQLEKLADYNTVIRQGINGPIFALIALDTRGYEIPVVEGVKVQTTREMLINFILNKEINKDKENAGGWALAGNNPDTDITAMAIQGLTPYYETNADVKAAVDRAITWLSSAQKDDGGYASWGSINSESISQVVVALTGLGIDPHTDPRFIKNGNSTIDALLTFAVSEGGFMHVRPGGTNNGGAEAGVVDGMATDQGTYALVAYDRFVNGKNPLYDMTDVEFKPQEPEKFTANRVGEGSLKKGSSAELKFNIENISEKDEEVTLAIVLYEKETNEMKNYSFVKKTLKIKEKEEFAGGFIIPAEGDYVVKAIICDDLSTDHMNLFIDPIVIDVE